MGPNVAAVEQLGCRCLEEELLECARVLFNNVGDFAQLTTVILPPSLVIPPPPLVNDPPSLVNTPPSLVNDMPSLVISLVGRRPGRGGGQLGGGAARLRLGGAPPPPPRAGTRARLCPLGSSLMSRPPVVGKPHSAPVACAS